MTQFWIVLGRMIEVYNQNLYTFIPVKNEQKPMVFC